MVGDGFVITGVVSVPGTVAIAGLGAAVVTGLTWYLLWTPVTGDIGSRTLTATATATSDGSTSSVSVTFTVVAAAAYPAIATPAVWYDGRQPAWADAGATVPAVAPNGLVQRVDEPSPLTGSWTAPTVGERPIRDGAGVRFEALGAAGGYQLTRPSPGGIYRDACTLVVAFMARDNAFAGPLMGLLEETTQYTGIEIGSNLVNVRTSSGVQSPGSMIIAPGKLNVIAVTYTPTGGEVKLDADGTVTTATFTASATHTATGDYDIGVKGAAYEYCSLTQAFVIPSALSSTDRDLAMAFAKSQPAPQAYPDDRALLVWVGDSITRSTATSYQNCFASLTLGAARAAGYPAENYNVAVGGAGVNRQVDPTTGTTPTSSNIFLRGSAAYSATRVHNVLVIAMGCNNLAAGNSTDFILFGTGAEGPTYPGSGLYPMIDAAVAQGWKVVVVVPGPRSDNAPFQATYNANRAIVCNHLVANGPAHGALVVDTRGIVNYGRDGDSDNTTYYSADKIHPIDAGHALVAPYVSAAVIALLASAPPATGGQYAYMRALFRGALSGNNPAAANPSDGEALGFFGQIAVEASGASPLAAPQQAEIGYAFRGLLSGNLAGTSNPSDADVLAFWVQLGADASGAPALGGPRYMALKATLRGAVSLNYPGTQNPSLQDLLGYFAAVSGH